MVFLPLLCSSINSLFPCFNHQSVAMAGKIFWQRALFAPKIQINGGCFASFFLLFLLWFPIGSLILILALDYFSLILEKSKCFELVHAQRSLGIFENPKISLGHCCLALLNVSILSPHVLLWFKWGIQTYNPPYSGWIILSTQICKEFSMVGFCPKPDFLRIRISGFGQGESKEFRLYGPMFECHQIDGIGILRRNWNLLVFWILILCPCFVWIMFLC